MKSIARVIAEGTGRGGYMTQGSFGKVYNHGPDKIYKEAYYDGTGVWLERCFAIQKRLGINHPLCEGMPEIFEFKRTSRSRYTVVMRKYTRIYDCHPIDGKTYSDVPSWDEHYSGLVDAVLGGQHANDMHRGNILWCQRDKRWVVVDPSTSTASKCGPQDPKFNRAKRVATQYGPQRRQ
jgi:hypothetical protein